MIPATGIADFYGGTNSVSYNNALGFFVLMWAVFNLFFLLASTKLCVIPSVDSSRVPVLTNLSSNAVYVAVFSFIELCLIFDAASYFASADGKTELGINLMKVSGAFGFVASLLGYYTVLHYLCEDALPFPVPMGDFTKYRMKKKEKN